VFQSLIDDLKSLLKLHKFVDGCALTKIIKELNTSRMQLEIGSADCSSSLTQGNKRNAVRLDHKESTTTTAAEWTTY